MRKVLDLASLIFFFGFGLFAALHADMTAARQAAQANFTAPAGSPDCDCMP